MNVDIARDGDQAGPASHNAKRDMGCTQADRCSGSLLLMQCDDDYYDLYYRGVSLQVAVITVLQNMSHFTILPLQGWLASIRTASSLEIGYAFHYTQLKDISLRYEGMDYLGMWMPS